MKTLKISKTLHLPPSTDTSTLIVYGGKGMGKTNLGAVLAEELAAAGLRWSWLDPLGVSWGLRHSADGKGPGIECLILGGLHGDVPIEPSGGAAVADIVVEESVNVLIDFSRKPSGEMWSLHEKVRFVTAYASRLFQRQGEIVNGRRRQNLMQILDEAARYIPQAIPAGDRLGLPECKAAWDVIVEEGRNVGLGVALLTQRSARMAKSVSELADAMFAFRTIGPNSLEAVTDWLGEHVDKARIKELSSHVRSLEVGQALVVSPGWLKFEGVVTIRMRETFDSSATPKSGAPVAKGEGAKPDLTAIRQRMAATIERAKQDDPKELKKKIAEQKKQLEILQASRNSTEVYKSAAPILTDADRALLEKLDSRIVGFTEAVNLNIDVEAVKRELVTIVSDMFAGVLKEQEEARADFLKALDGKRIGTIREKVDGYNKIAISAGSHQSQSRISRNAPVSAQSRSEHQRKSVTERPVVIRPSSNGSGDVHLPPAKQKILNALAWLEGIGRRSAERAVVAFLAKTSSKSSAYENNVSALRTAGLIEYPGPNLLALTQDGRTLAAAPPSRLTPSDLHAELEAMLPPAQWRLVSAAIEAYPDALTRSDLAARASTSGASSAFENNVSRLKSLGLFTYPRKGEVAGSPLLFLEAP